MEIPNKALLEKAVMGAVNLTATYSLKELNAKLTGCGFETKLLGPVNTMRMEEEIKHSSQLLYYWHQGRASSIHCRLVISYDKTATAIGEVAVSAIKF